MANTIKVRRGTKASMPTLAIGELGLATDTYELFVGTSAGNKPVSGFLADAAYLLASADSRLSNARTIAAGDSISITDGGAGGSLTIDTIQDIRTTAIPRFAGFEVYSEAYAYTVVRGAGDYTEVGYTLQRARGALETPSAIQSGDTLGYVQWMGYDGSDYASALYVFGKATQNWTTTAHGTRMMFYTTPNGSTSPTERMRIDHDGVVYIYSTANPCLSLSGGLKIGTLGGVLFASSGTVSALEATAGSQYLRRNAGNTAYEWATLTASDLPAHATRHESGGADAITGNLDANARVSVRINSGSTTYKRRRINFVAGSGISLSMSDDSANEEIDLTVAATGGGGGAPSDATYLTWATPPSSLPAARLVITRSPIIVNKDTEGEYKFSAMVPIASETAAYTLETVTLLFSSMVANDAYLRWGKQSHIAWAVFKSTSFTEVFAGSEQITGTLSYTGMDATTTPNNILTWDAATSLFRTTATADQTAYVEVDLGATYSGYCFVKFRLGVYSSGTARARLYTSTDRSSWSYVNEWTHTTSTGAYVIYAHYTGGARYIRITLWKESGTYAFLGAGYTTAGINKIFFFKNGDRYTLSDYMASYTVLPIDGSVASSSPARRGILSLSSYGPSTTAPSLPSGLSWGVSVCIH